MKDIIPKNGTVASQSTGPTHILIILAAIQNRSKFILWFLWPKSPDFPQVVAAFLLRYRDTLKHYKGWSHSGPNRDSKVILWHILWQGFDSRLTQQRGTVLEVQRRKLEGYSIPIHSRISSPWSFANLHCLLKSALYAVFGNSVYYAAHEMLR